MVFLEQCALDRFVILVWWRASFRFDIVIVKHDLLFVAGIHEPHLAHAGLGKPPYLGELALFVPACVVPEELFVRA